MINQPSQFIQPEQEMNNETFEASQEAHKEATSEATTAPIDATWARLVPGTENAATDPVELVDDSDDEDAAADESQVAGRGRANLLLRRAMARRMIAARELNGFAQTEAALLIGWKNATQLSLIEQGKRMPPHHILLLISRAYGVSTDFLYTLDDEPERDGRTAAKKAQVRQIAEMLQRNAEAVTEALFETHRFNPAPELRASRVITRVTALCAAVDKFRATNVDQFDTTRGSALLLHAAKEAGEAVEKVGDLLDQADRRAEFALRHGRAAMAGDGSAK